MTPLGHHGALLRNIFLIRTGVIVIAHLVIMSLPMIISIKEVIKPLLSFVMIASQINFYVQTGREKSLCVVKQF